jgi:hypothetical protein
MLSLNGMRRFGVKLKNKIVRAWPKADDIIPLRADRYNMSFLYGAAVFTIFNQNDFLVRGNCIIAEPLPSSTLSTEGIHFNATTRNSMDWFPCGLHMGKGVSIMELTNT